MWRGCIKLRDFGSSVVGTYFLMVLMGIGIRFVYRTSFLTAVVAALVSFLPISVALIWLRVTTAGLASL
jgi:hypothetical protein